MVPDAEEARRLATEELSRGIYDERTGLVERLIAWVLERLDDLSALSQSDVGWLVPVGAVLLTVAALVLTVVVGIPRRRRRAQRPVAGVLEGDARSVDELLAAARSAAERGDFSAAVLDRFRALVRSLVGRALITERPGLTAHEAAAEAAGRLPQQGDDLEAASRLFDRVRYGDTTASQSDEAWLREVCAGVTAARAEPLARR